MSFLALSAQAAEYWVNPATGNDGQDGSAATPFASISYALNQLGSGDTLHLSAGTHQMAETYQPVALENVALLGAGSSETFVQPETGLEIRHIFMQSCTNITFSGMTLQNAKLYANASNNEKGGSTLIKDSLHITFDDCVFYNNELASNVQRAYAGCMAVSNSFVRILNSEFSDNRMSGRVVGVASAISVWGDGWTKGVYYAGIAVTNTYFHHNHVSDWNGTASPIGLIHGTIRTQSDFYNCRFAYNSGSGGTTPIMQYQRSLIGTEIINNQFSEYSANPQDIMSFTKCTFAQNLVGHVFDDCVQRITLTDCAFYGQRKIWYNKMDRLTFNHCAFERPIPSKPNVVFENESIVGELTMRPDLSVDPTSEASNCGYYPSSGEQATYRTVWVDANAETSGTGLHEDSPLNSFTAALAMLQDGDTIKLAPGSYNLSKEAYPIALKRVKFITIEGSGTGDEGTIFEPNDASYTGNFMTLEEAFDVTLRNFTIRGFNNTQMTDIPSALRFSYGGTILVENLTIEGCNREWWQANKTQNGAHIDFYRVMGYWVNNCRMFNNTVNVGNWVNFGVNGGVGSFRGSFGMLSNSVFTNNVVGARNIYGCVLYFDAVSLQISAEPYKVRNCFFNDNRLSDVADRAPITFSGGVIYSRGFTTFLFLENCTVIGAIPGKKALEFRVDGPNPNNSSKFAASNCIFDCMGTGLLVRDGFASINHCVIVEDEECTPETFKILEGEISTKVGRNLGTSANNQFVSAIEYRRPERQNFTLSTSSPAVDAGRREYWMMPLTEDPDNMGWPQTTPIADLNGNLRVIGPAPDAGCYELPYALPTLLKVK